MSKRNTKLTQEEIQEMKLNSELAEIQADMPFLPKNPTYTFEPGDRVELGHLEDVYVVEKLYDGLVYKIRFTAINSNYGKELRISGERYVPWVNIRKYISPEENSSLETFTDTGDDMMIQFFNSRPDSILSYKYHSGIDMTPDYQRDYVWTLEDKVNLIDSIFRRIEIGKIVLIERKDNDWNKSKPSFEVLDGKQRINALSEFFEDRFRYKGKLYSELSTKDKSTFDNAMLSLGIVKNVTKEQILKYFIKLNTTGKVMDLAHLDNVKQMLGK